LDSLAGEQARREDEAQAAGKPAGLTVRGWVLALAAQIAILLWVVRTEITARVFVSSWTLSMPAVILLLALLAWNAARRGRAFTRGELLAAYVAVSSTVTLAGYNFFQVLIPTLGTGLYLQSPENRWDLVLQYIPPWLLPRDPHSLRGLFHGESAVPWDSWIPALAAWGSLVLAVAFAGLALNGLLADLWIRKERLAFPVASLPLEMSAPGTPLFRSRTMWLAFAIPVVLNSLLALNYYYPGVPAVPLKHRDMLDPITTPPLAVLRPLSVGYTPFIIGLAYLAPLDVSFSIWFFLWFNKGQRILAYSLGYLDSTDLGARGEPHLDSQTVGAFLILGLLLLWRAWPRKARNEPLTEGDRPLEVVLRIVLAVSLLYTVGFMVLAGFTPGLAVALVLLYLLTVLVISRVRSEAGFAWAYGPDRFSASLSHVVVNVHGTAGLSPRSIALMGFFHWLWWDLRFALMPAQMDALKIGDGANIRRRQLLALMAAATVVAVVVGLAWALHDSYLFGWGTAKTYAGPSTGARQSYNLAVNWMRTPTYPRWDKTAWMGVGGAFTLFLGMMRGRFLWWPFHPIGYAMAATPTASAFWAHYLIAWAAKLVILRYGGMRLYRLTLPLVFGLILGDIASQTVWSIAASLLDIPVYQFVS
jgi:uncharacterized protein DUF6785/uncharacterized protein DUF6784